MKQLITLLLALMVSLTLFACTPGGKKSYLKVKCPACGYEFDSPQKP